MRVDRIILLIAIIRVVENRVAPYASRGSTCGEFKRKYLFVLTPSANENDLLTDLIKSAKSAIVKRPEIERDPVQILISPEDFTEFKRKSQALKVYKSHSLQCVDQTTNLGIDETNTSRSMLAWTALNGKAKENSSIKITSPLGLKTTKEFHSKMCRILNNCEPKFGEKIINASLSNDVKKFVHSWNSRISRASKTKKGTSKQKSKVKIATKFPISKTRSKPKGKKNSAKKNDATKVKKPEVAKKKTTLIPARRTSTKESWNKLMSLASKSLMKSNNTSKKSKPRKELKNSSTAIRKLLSSAKVVKSKKVTNAKKKSSKHANKSKPNNTRKSTARTSISAKKRTKSSNTRNRVNKQQKYRSKSQGGRKTSSAVYPKTSRKIVAKNRKQNRKSRELRISAETGTNCSDYNIIKRSLGYLIKRDLSFRPPGSCTVIKISTSCDGECLEDDENTGNLPNFPVVHGKIPVTSQSGLFVPEVLPDVLIQDNGVSGESVSRPLIHSNRIPDGRGSVVAEVLPPPPLLIEPDYVSDIDPPKIESVGPNDYPQEEETDKESNDNLSTESPLRQPFDEFPWFKPNNFIPPFVGANSTQRPYWVIHRPVGNEKINPPQQEYSTISPRPFEVPFGVSMGRESEEDAEDSDNYDEDNENDDDDDEDDDEEEYDEEYDEEEKENGIAVMSIPADLLNMIEDNYVHQVWNGKNIDDIEDSNDEDAYEDEENEGKDEDHDENEDYDDDDYEDDDDEDYVEESGNAGIGDEDDYDSDED